MIDIDYPRFSHIFDGARLNTETAAFQLCDIHDGMLKQMIEGTNDEDLRDECDVRELVLSFLTPLLTLLSLQGH